MKNLPPCEIWYVTGSQHLYGEAALKQVAANSHKDRPRNSTPRVACRCHSSSSPS